MLCVKCPNANLLDMKAKYESLVRCRRTRHCFGVCWHRCSDSRIGGETTQFKIEDSQTETADKTNYSRVYL